MEIQTTRKEALALTEWKQSQIGNGTALMIIKAQSSQTLRLRSEEDIKQVLRYAMVLVGLRGNNMPIDEEKFVLLNFIRTNYGNQTTEEIKIAFEMAISGKFNIDSKCYENFSCEYFGRIMNAYIEYARLETKNVKRLEIEEIKHIPSDSELKEQAINNVNSYVYRIKTSEKLGGKFEWTAGGLSHLYDFLVKFGIWVCPESDREQIKTRLRPKFTDDKIYNAECKGEAYKLFCHQLVEMDMTLDENGQIN